MRTVFYILILFCLTSCARVLLFLVGGKMPEVETFKDIKESGAKWNIRSDSVYLLKEDFVLAQLRRPTNEVLLFDHNGYSIDLTLVGDDPRCGGNIYGFTRGLGIVTYAQRDSSRVLEEEVNKTFHIDTRVPIKVDKTNDYFIVFYWNCFTGKQRNQEEISSLKKVIAENTRIKTQLILINSDMYEGVDWEQKEKAMLSP